MRCSASSARARGRVSRRAAVHGVGTRGREPELAVHADRRRILLVRVEHDLTDSPLAQVVQAGQGERAAQAAALSVGIDTHDVYLADAVRVDLGPVKAEHGAVAGVFGDEEPVGVEPGLLLAQFQVAAGPAALLRVLGEGPAVDPQPLLLVLAGPERAQ